MLKKNNFLCLCYHYIRTEQNYKKIPRILGTSELEFKSHLNMINNNFEIISESQLIDFFNEKSIISNDKPGMLFTFDDGLSDHFIASKILYDRKIKGVFFIPTCIIDDELPANPIIIHYGIAIFGVEKFLEIYHEGLAYNKLDEKKLHINFLKEKDNVWNTITEIKNIFKYNLSNRISRNLLLYIYENLILDKFPDALDFMHLNSEQIKEMIEMGHSIGVHTHTHISVGSKKKKKNEFEKEMINPKNILKQRFNTKIHSLSYPFGDKKDCLSSIELIKKTSDYKFAFTVEKKINSTETNPLEIGRYQPTSRESSQELLKTLNQICQNGSQV